MISSTSPASKKGFTVVEMLVSVGIMLALSGIIAFNQSKYSSGAQLRNHANNLSLSLRQAQVYGISVKEFSPGTNDFNVGYGVEFNIGASGSNNSYVFFADRGVRNSLYDDGWYCPVGGTSECLDKVTLSQGNYIEELCLIDSNGDEYCTPERLDITFVRPQTEANIVFDGDPEDTSNVRGARIRMSSIDGKRNSVVVYTTGQISVQNE